ncbi:sugar ABC transporter permease [Rhizobium sp. SG_E_25_P2]|jgi:multiple sugar transport system permease protein|uniref:carbohydrate ABC transporter permease n=1 Tax=Rhizobium sp. SG_E_25_P2 TaxID=2879942 RepID=UPI00247655B4|nr:sugar ABC transporter permease [Rhizobium sp. SG_E_25_P2]
MTRVGSATEKRIAYLFIAPAILLVAVFRIFPLISGFVLSFFDTDGMSTFTFVGFDNYVALASDDAFRDSVENTLILIATLPVWVALPMVLAILIHQGVPGGRFFRAVYFLPAVLSSVIVGSIFNMVLRYDGSLNAMLKAIGLIPVDWLGSGWTALFCLFAVQLWSTFGMSLLIFMAGLSTVPKELVEAARLDGAKPLQVWIHVIIPALKPIIEFVGVVTTIGALTSMFGLIYVLTAGGPGTSTALPEFLIWLEQGKMNRPGYAAAISMLLFSLMAGLAYIQIKIMSKNANL